MTSQNDWPYVINLGNSIIGVAVLAMPFCFKQCGIILGTLMLLFCTWVTLVSCQLLMKAGTTSRRTSFGNLAYHTHGAPAKLAAELGMIGLQLGTLIAQIVVIGDLGPAIISKALGIENTWNLRTGVIMFLCLCVGLPLGLLKDLKSVSKASTICVCFYTVFVFYVLTLSLPNLWTGSWYPKVSFWRTDGLFQCLPIFSFSFGCQTQLFIMYDSLPEPSLKKMNGIISSAVNLCTVAYLLVGFFGYIAFCDKEIGGDIITTFPINPSTDLIKLAFVVSIAITFPLMIFPCRASLYGMLFAPAKAHDDMPSDFRMPEIHFKFITVVIVCGSMTIGIAVPNVEFILGLNGATMGTLICYIFPALFFLKVMTNSSEGKILAQIILVFGVTVLLVSTFATLYSQDKGHVHEDIVKKVDIPAGLENIKESPGKMNNPVDNIPVAAPADNDKKDDHRIEPPIPNAPDDKVIAQDNKKDVKKDDTAVKDKQPMAGKPTEKRNEREADAKKDAPSDELKRSKKEEQKNLAEEKERERKLKEGEQKQKQLLQELAEQKEVQQKLIDEQKELLKELKKHQKEAHAPAAAAAAAGGAGQQNQNPNLNPQAQAPQAQNNVLQPQQAGQGQLLGQDQQGQGQLVGQGQQQVFNQNIKAQPAFQNVPMQQQQQNVIPGQVLQQNQVNQGQQLGQGQQVPQQINPGQQQVQQLPQQVNQGQLQGQGQQLPLQVNQGQLQGQGQQLPQQINQGQLGQGQQLPLQVNQGQLQGQGQQLPQQVNQGQQQGQGQQVPQQVNQGQLQGQGQQLPLQVNQGQLQGQGNANVQQIVENQGQQQDQVKAQVRMPELQQGNSLNAQNHAEIQNIQPNALNNVQGAGQAVDHAAAANGLLGAGVQANQPVVAKDSNMVAENQEAVHHRQKRDTSVLSQNQDNAKVEGENKPDTKVEQKKEEQKKILSVEENEKISERLKEAAKEDSKRGGGVPNDEMRRRLRGLEKPDGIMSKEIMAEELKNRGSVAGLGNVRSLKTLLSDEE